MILMFLLTKFHNSIFQIRFSVVTCLCLWHNIWNKWYYQVNGSHNTNGCHLQFGNTCVNETNKSRNFITFSIIFRDKWHDLNIGNGDICWFEHKPYLRSELWSLIQLNTLDQQPLTVSASWVASSSEMEQELLEIYWWLNQTMIGIMIDQTVPWKKLLLLHLTKPLQFIWLSIVWALCELYASTNLSYSYNA